MNKLALRPAEVAEVPQVQEICRSDNPAYRQTQSMKDDIPMTTVLRGEFDRQAFAAAVNLRRQSLALSWSEVAEQSGVSLCTLSRLNRGLMLSANTMAALVVWAELDANSFFTGQSIPACTLCGMPGSGGGSHKSLVDCVMALKSYVASLERRQLERMELLPHYADLPE